MQYFTEKIGDKGAQATFYLQDREQKRRAPVIVIVPGGAYYGTLKREMEPVALAFLGKGYACVVLDYATEGFAFYREKMDVTKEPVSAFPNPLVDLAKTLVKVRQHADEWGLAAEKVNLIGFSAGGNLIGQLGAYWDETWLHELVGFPSAMYQPNSLCLAYGATLIVKQPLLTGFEQIDQATLGADQSEERIELVNMLDKVNEKMPPTFIWHTVEDKIVPVRIALQLALNLDQANVPYELHVYQKGPHCLSLSDQRVKGLDGHMETDAQVATWTNLYLGWLQENGFGLLED